MSKNYQEIYPKEIIINFIKVTVKNFEEQYFLKYYSNDVISTALKIKPQKLMSFIYSNIYHCLKHGIEANNENFSLDKEIFKYINFCFKQIYFCTYEEYIQVFKRKIFQHYGEKTIHHFSYLRKSQLLKNLDCNFKLKIFDDESLSEIYNKNKKFYWLYISLLQEIEKIKEKNGNYTIEHLEIVLKNNGLNQQGWDFLNSQNEHYITRMGQILSWGIFCSNFQLKDAWLRNKKHKILFSRIHEKIFKKTDSSFSYLGKDVDSIYLLSQIKKLYLHIGKKCSKWNKPVTKFNMVSFYALKLLTRIHFQTMDIKTEISNFILNKKIDFSKKSVLEAILEEQKFFNNFLSDSFIPPIMESLVQIDEDRYYNENIYNFIEQNFNYKLIVNSLGELDNKPNFIDYTININYQDLKYIDYEAFVSLGKETKNNINLSEIKKHLDKNIFIEEKYKSINSQKYYTILFFQMLNKLFYSDESFSIKSHYNKICEDFFNNFQNRELIENNLNLKRIVTLDEINKINNENRVIQEQPLLFKDFFNYVPYSGDNYLKNVKEYFFKYYGNNNGWKNLLNVYKNNKSFSFISSFRINYLDEENVIKNFLNACFFNNIGNIKYLNFFNKYIFNYIDFYNFRKEDPEYYNFQIKNLCMLIDSIFKSLNILIEKQKNNIKIKNEDIMLSLFSESRKKYYLNYIQRNNSVKIKDLFTTDMRSISDYIFNGNHNRLLPKANLKKILENTKKWEEENLKEKLVYFDYKEEEYSYLTIDKKYTFQQIKNTTDILEEAEEMKHCIAQYNYHCSKNNYVAYSMTSKDGERATLGIVKKSNTYTFQQIYSYRNRQVSKNAKNSAKYLVEILNESLN